MLASFDKLRACTEFTEVMSVNRLNPFTVSLSNHAIIGEVY